jgi:hypothetical protein
MIYCSLLPSTLAFGRIAWSDRDIQLDDSNLQNIFHRCRAPYNLDPVLVRECWLIFRGRFAFFPQVFHSVFHLVLAVVWNDLLWADFILMVVLEVTVTFPAWPASHCSCVLVSMRCGWCAKVAIYTGVIMQQPVAFSKLINYCSDGRLYKSQSYSISKFCTSQCNNGK